MKEVILAIILCAFFSSNCLSQTKQESIKQLFHIIKTDSLTEKMISSIFTSSISQVQLKDSVSQVHFKEKINSMMLVIKDITNKMMDDDMVVIYDKYFTQNEINDFISFYKSPSGQRLTNSEPDIMKEVMTVMVQKYIPEIKKAVTATMEEKK